MSDKCPSCNEKLKCMAWRSAHPSNWYCPACESLPQDVEEFIEQQPGGIDDDDLRAWMTGHVRVPVEAFDVAKEALESIVSADWRKWEELSSPEEFVRWAKSRAKHALSILSAHKDK